MTEPNWRLALQGVEGDRELLCDVIDAYLEECPKQVKQLRQALVDGDAVVVRRMAHTIKGSLRLFELTEISEIAAQIEAMGESGQLEGAAEKSDALFHRLENLEPKLRAFMAGDEA